MRAVELGPRLLVLDCSSTSKASVSGCMGRTLEAALRERHTGLQTCRRSLAHAALPAIDPHEAMTPVARELAAELAQSDLLLITAPVHNYTVPVGLKAWIDHVVRPGVGFRHTPGGKMGLMRDRTTLIATSAGGSLFEERAMQPDFFRPYLAAVLRTIGITQLHWIALERSDQRIDAAAEAERLARSWVTSSWREVMA